MADPCRANVRGQPHERVWLRESAGGDVVLWSRCDRGEGWVPVWVPADAAAGLLRAWVFRCADAEDDGESRPQWHQPHGGTREVQ